VGWEKTPKNSTKRVWGQETIQRREARKRKNVSHAREDEGEQVQNAKTKKKKDLDKTKRPIKLPGNCPKGNTKKQKLTDSSKKKNKKRKIQMEEALSERYCKYGGLGKKCPGK